MTTALGYHFVAYYYYDDTSHYLLMLKRRPVGGGPWKVIAFPGTYVPTSGLPQDGDTHATPNVAVSLVDKRIHLAYGHDGTGTVDLRYRISDGNPPADCNDADFTLANLFPSGAGNERNYLKVGEVLEDVAYPIFVTRESNNQLIMFFRQNLAGVSGLYKATYNNNGTWGTKLKLIDGSIGTYDDPTEQYPNSTNRKAYISTIATYGAEIHLTWTWHETNLPPDTGIDHDLHYVKSTDGGNTWINRNGGQVSLPITLNTACRIWNIDYSWQIMHNGGCAVDSDGNTHIALKHAEASGSATKRYWHYVRIGSSVTRTMIPYQANDRPKLFIDRTADTAYVVARTWATGGIRPISIYAAQCEADTGETNWDKWTEVFSSSSSGVSYMNEFNGRLSSDGTTLWILAQRAGADANSTYSRLDVDKFALDFYGTP